MEIDEWWPNLGDSAKSWLIANNGDALPSWVVADISAAGGVFDSAAQWVGENGPDRFLLSDRATDWIESVANDET